MTDGWKEETPALEEVFIPAPTFPSRDPTRSALVGTCGYVTLFPSRRDRTRGEKSRDSPVHASRSQGPTSGFRDWPNGGKGSPAARPYYVETTDCKTRVPDPSTRPLALPPLPPTSSLAGHKARDQGTREALRRTPLSSRHTYSTIPQRRLSQPTSPSHPSRPYRACAASLHLYADHSSESTPRRFRDRNTARRIETASSPRRTPYITHDNDPSVTVTPRFPERRFYIHTDEPTNNGIPILSAPLASLRLLISLPRTKPCCSASLDVLPQDRPGSGTDDSINPSNLEGYHTGE
ncbi:uncharacterized protein CLUP02_18256 [Colletotrichum lupini]|uniref:Uncharacterized protein n=1 Tax=Colletotrichum lupini TaxID=145971 RepID=A0A9Q8SG27_9PEZI|nr:uncharacterized protein CLUP02_18256 [Colletotrichum lupini]UQC76741.1 hypothetical protein CLUP02_18256 [Colletotrichum lupini]